MEGLIEGVKEKESERGVRSRRWGTSVNERATAGMQHMLMKEFVADTHQPVAP